MEQGDRVICAISGGADSVALLWCLYLLREQLDLKLSAAHLNHGLRGEESDRDEDFVRQLCAGYQIPLTVGRTQVQAQGRGLEDAARRARYTFLESLDPAAKIATAHTADDNAETVRNRLAVYHQQTSPLVEYYRKKGLLGEVKGNGGIEAVFEEICRIIDNAK